MIVNALKQLLLTEETSVTDIVAIQHIPSRNLRYLTGITVLIVKYAVVFHCTYSVTNCQTRLVAEPWPVPDTPHQHIRTQ